MRKKALVIILFLVSTAAYWSCNNSAEPEENKRKSAKYVGSVNCKSCHESEYAQWQDSHHYQSMLLPNAETVLANFDTTVFLDQVEYFFYSEHGNYFVKSIDHSDTSVYKVMYTFGFKPLQQFLTETEPGKLQTIRASWDTEEQTWFHQYDDEVIHTNDWLHWTNQSQNWNSMCADCHSTNLRKNFDPSKGKYHTTYDEINVACESCHGPGSKHIDLAEKKSWDKKEMALYPKAKNNVQQIEQCAPCHARRSMVVDHTNFGKKFYDQFFPQVLDDAFYEPDGQIKEEDYVYTSFASSKMYHRNVSCNNCHNPHSNELRFEGNMLCMQCHKPEYNSKGHHFHSPDGEGASCINCHMDGKYYMGNDYRRDHSFRVPRPDQSEKYGTSNACISCHTKKDNNWASEAIINWYGTERPKHFSDLLLKGNLENDLSSLLILIEDTSYPAMARATAIRYLRRFSPDLYQQNLIPWSHNENSIIRIELLRLISDFPDDIRIPISVNRLTDSLKSVRIIAFSNLLGDYDKLTLAQKTDWMNVEKEYKVYLDYNADFREGQVHLAQYQMGKGNPQAAIAALEKSIEIDSLFPEPYINLAVLSNQTGQNQKSLNVLNEMIKRFPENDYAFYLRSILKAELQDLEGAKEDMTEAIDLNANADYYYNLILIENQMGNAQSARELLREAVQQFPQNERLRQLRI